MNIILYKPLYYDINQCAYDINYFLDEGVIKDTINSLFLVKTSAHFSWLYSFKRWGRIYDNYPLIYWSLSNPREEVFKKLEVVSVY